MWDLVIIAGRKSTQRMHPVKPCKANSSAQMHPTVRKVPVILNEQALDLLLVASQPELCGLF